MTKVNELLRTNNEIGELECELETTSYALLELKSESSKMIRKLRRTKN